MMPRRFLLAAAVVLSCAAGMVPARTEAAPPPCGEAYCCLSTSTPDTKCNNNGSPGTCAVWFYLHVCP